MAELGTVEQFGYRQELARRLSLPDMVGYGLIYMVPIAPFAIFGSVYQSSGGMPALVYLVGAVALFFTANSYQQMARAFPLAGSVYSYSGRALGAPVGFFTGWAILLDYILVPALLYLVAAIAMNSTVPQVPVWLWLIIFVAVNTIVNLRGIRITAVVTKIMVVGEIVVLAMFLAIGVWALAGGQYAGEFYARVRRLLTRNGRFFHYIGDPDSPSGGRTTKGVVKRLHDAGFTRVSIVKEAFGVLASV